ncbi:transporter C11D3.06 [Apiospora rasikravindrae]|uniref:Transporter C11D3.06 n=1 Tax=Apiospora rasikravindrae TaxID=990691 RepID=A0ABR1TFU0_9PEZI
MTTATTTMSWPPDPERHVDEASPLLAQSSTGPTAQHSKRRSEYVAWLQEMWFLTKAAVPVILAYMLQNSLQTVSVLVVGRLSPEALSVSAFSYMFAMATAWLIALGGTSALDTLASSSFTRSKDKTSLGALLQRGILVLTGFYAVVVAIWCGAEPLFRALGQPESICVGSARFLRLLIPGGLGYVWFECMKKYLQGVYSPLGHSQRHERELTPVVLTAQAIYHPGTYALMITSPLNAFLNWLLIYKFNMGLDGAPIATGISYWLSFLYLVGYTRFVQGKDCWGGLDLRRAASNVAPFAKLALLGVVHVGTEWWAFEIVALAAGRLGRLPLAAQSVVMTADQIINTIPFGLGVAESSRLGNLLGAEDARGARRSAHAAAVLSVLFGSVILAVLMGTRNVVGGCSMTTRASLGWWPRWFRMWRCSRSRTGLMGVVGGALRGMGRQWVGALVNCVSYYGGALPGGIYLAFNGGWGLAGLWMGQLVALSLVGVLEWVIVGLSKWDKEVKKAVDRLDHDEVDVADEEEEC